jgi:hypothetical protein
MTEQELIILINEFSQDKVQKIESIDTKLEDGKVTVIGISGVKRIKFTLTESGDFSSKFLSNIY